MVIEIVYYSSQFFLAGSLFIAGRQVEWLLRAHIGLLLVLGECIPLRDGRCHSGWRRILCSELTKIMHDHGTQPLRHPEPLLLYIVSVTEHPNSYHKVWKVGCSMMQFCFSFSCSVCSKLACGRVWCRGKLGCGCWLGWCHSMRHSAHWLPVCAWDGEVQHLCIAWISWMESSLLVDQLCLFCWLYSS